jgi:hypothetical protein
MLPSVMPVWCACSGWVQKFSLPHAWWRRRRILCYSLSDICSLHSLTAIRASHPKLMNRRVWSQGRHVLWGWLQERRAAGSYDYSGCMTVPRLLYLEDERLIQVRHPATLWRNHTCCMGWSTCKAFNEVFAGNTCKLTLPAGANP